MQHMKRSTAEVGEGQMRDIIASDISLDTRVKATESWPWSSFKLFESVGTLSEAKCLSLPHLGLLFLTHLMVVIKGFFCLGFVFFLFFFSFVFFFFGDLFYCRSKSSQYGNALC